MIILGIKLSNRIENALEFQKVISKYGCSIRTRIGLHDAQENQCSPNGVIILEVIDKEASLQLEKDLLKIDEIEIQKMVFN